MRTKVGENGVLIPKELLTGITEVDIRKQNGVIMVIPAGKDDPIYDIGKEPVAGGVSDASESLDKYVAHPEEPAAKQPQFGSARGLINIPDDFDAPVKVTIEENNPPSNGDSADLIMHKSKAEPHAATSYPLRGTVIKYEAPTEPVGVEDWDASR